MRSDFDRKETGERNDDTNASAVPLMEPGGVSAAFPHGFMPLAHQPGCGCHECRKLDEPMAWKRNDNATFYCDYSLRDLIFRAVFSELSGNSVLHYLIRRNLQKQLQAIDSHKQDEG